MLGKAGMTTADLVKVTTPLIDAKNIPTYARVSGEILGDVRPALYSRCHGKLFGSGLGRPGILTAHSNCLHSCGESPRVPPMWGC
jgi:hypothetical protein